MATKTTWILVADGARARIFKRQGAGGALLLAPEDNFVHEVERTHDMGSERPGRVVESSGGAHHAIAPRADWNRQGKQQFAERLAKHLDAAAERKEFDRLILVAPPRVLGDLRASLGRHAREHLAGELDKDLTALGTAEIGERLAQAELG